MLQHENMMKIIMTVLIIMMIRIMKTMIVMIIDNFLNMSISLIKQKKKLQ